MNSLIRILCSICICTSTTYGIQNPFNTTSMPLYMRVDQLAKDFSNFKQRQDLFNRQHDEFVAHQHAINNAMNNFQSAQEQTNTAQAAVNQQQVELNKKYEEVYNITEAYRNTSVATLIKHAHNTIILQRSQFFFMLVGVCASLGGFKYLHNRTQEKQHKETGQQPKKVSYKERLDLAACLTLIGMLGGYSVGGVLAPLFYGE